MESEVMRVSETGDVLDGFKTYYMASGTASITFSKNGLGVSKAAVAKLENSPHARILLDYSGKRMAIIRCSEDDDGAVRLARDNKDGARWNSSDLCETIKRITGWAVDGKERYTILGDFVEHDGVPALIFDFSKATKV